ncbi:DUF3445 domain-containing protein [Mesorhizobium sp. CAU 1732]|uniref:heme-dependent oxidative N-demethylase family protein n=1 Tax=Mesorhizobium sp. CAU 1732 TaxID=3140358 RepID=UPI00325FF8A4
MRLKHTPYDGSSAPFTIGLKPLALPDWIEVDDLLGAYLAEKDRLYATIPENVFVAENDTHDAQAEVLQMLAEHLPQRFPDTYVREGNGLRIVTADRTIRVENVPTISPLVTASRLVQEDLVLMRRGENGWRLAAASLCFPSSWDLREKFGRPLADIHEPVPDFGRGTRAAGLIERMFDNLQGQAVQRFNWSLQAGPDLYHPLTNTQRNVRGTERPLWFPTEDPVAAAFIRVERQTLRKLPVSGDILFTIRIFVDPMRRLASHPDGTKLAHSFADQLDLLDHNQLAYKGLVADRDGLAERLRALASTTN